MRGCAGVRVCWCAGERVEMGKVEEGGESGQSASSRGSEVSYGPLPQNEGGRRRKCGSDEDGEDDTRLEYG